MPTIRNAETPFCFTKLCGVTILTTLGCRVDVETVVLQPRSDSQEVADEAGDLTVEHSGVAGKHVGVQHPGFVLLDHNWNKKGWKASDWRLAFRVLPNTDPGLMNLRHAAVTAVPVYLHLSPEPRL